MVHMNFFVPVFITLYVGFMAYVCIYFGGYQTRILFTLYVRVKMKFLSLYLSNVCFNMT